MAAALTGAAEVLAKLPGGNKLKQAVALGVALQRRDAKAAIKAALELAPDHPATQGLRTAAKVLL